MPELASTRTPSEDDRLLQAEQAVRDYVGWHVAPQRQDTVLVPALRSVWVLPTLKLVTLDKVLDPTGAELDLGLYTANGVGVLTRSPGYPLWLGTYANPSTLAVTFTHGYDQPPATVTAVVQALATRALDNPYGYTRSQVGPFADFYSQTGQNQAAPLGLLDAERALLDPYRLPRLA